MAIIQVSPCGLHVLFYTVLHVWEYNAAAADDDDDDNDDDDDDDDDDDEIHPCLFSTPVHCRLPAGILSLFSDHPLPLWVVQTLSAWRRLYIRVRVVISRRGVLARVLLHVRDWGAESDEGVRAPEWYPPPNARCQL